MSAVLTSTDHLFARFVETWKTNNGAAVASLFTEDGSLVSPFGERADGADAIGAMYAEYFAGMLSGTTTEVETQVARAVGEDHAFVDCEQTIHGPAGDIVLVVHLSALLRRDGGDWKFVDARPYTTPSAA